MIIYNFKNYNFFLLLKMGFKNMSFNVIMYFRMVIVWKCMKY